MSYTKCSEFASEEPVARDLDLMSGLKNSGSDDIWGEMVFKRNGESHMSFKLNLQYHKAMDNIMVERCEKDLTIVLLNYKYLLSDKTGTWTAGVPSTWEWASKDLENKVAFFKAKKVYKVVSVVQPPFMQWNETKSKVPLVIRFVRF